MSKDTHPAIWQGTATASRTQLSINATEKRYWIERPRATARTFSAKFVEEIRRSPASMAMHATGIRHMQVAR